MLFIVKWRLQGETAQTEATTAKEALHKAQEVMADGAEDISITNPQGECFDIDYFGLITKTIDGDTP
jgi:hypothetical protein